jgi:hypothetical protein
LVARLETSPFPLLCVSAATPLTVFSRSYPLAHPVSGKSESTRRGGRGWWPPRPMQGGRQPGVLRRAHSLRRGARHMAQPPKRYRRTQAAARGNAECQRAYLQIDPSRLCVDISLNVCSRACLCFTRAPEEEDVKAHYKRTTTNPRRWKKQCSTSETMCTLL